MNFSQPCQAGGAVATGPLARPSSGGADHLRPQGTGASPGRTKLNLVIRAASAVTRALPGSETARAIKPRHTTRAGRSLEIPVHKLNLISTAVRPRRVIGLEEHPRLADIDHRSLTPLTLAHSPVAHPRLDREALGPLSFTRCEPSHRWFCIISGRSTRVASARTESRRGCFRASTLLNTQMPRRAGKCACLYH